MPMSTSQTPYGKETAVATKSDSSTSDSKTTKAATKEPEPATGPLARAGESGDPVVQKLLAERELNRMHVEPDPVHAEQREQARRNIQAIDAELEKLGYTAQ